MNGMSQSIRLKCFFGAKVVASYLNNSKVKLSSSKISSRPASKFAVAAYPLR